jgi:glycerophosphoryl diester phosphodiesterase
MAHWEYADQGRRPWLYRPAGSMTVPDDDHIPYPRVCAHRGFNSIAPENSMPAFGAAVALGAEEIEFDIWATKDGELVSIHDPSLDRVSDGSGKVSDYTFEELQRFDFGRKRGERFNGLRIIRFEDILKKFACSVIMNIHVKIWDTHEDVDRQYGRIAALIRQYGCEKHVYMMTGNEQCQREFRAIAPDIHRCMGFGDCPKDDPLEHVRRAIRQGCQKIQLFKPYFTQESVDMAHEHGILCNVFYADDPEEACRYIDMGIDTILTNDYLQISNAVRRHLAEKAGE